MDVVLFTISSVIFGFHEHHRRELRIQAEADKCILYGACHCKAIKFKFKTPRYSSVWKCNCSICNMKKNDHVVVKEDDFELIKGSENLIEYKFNTKVARHKFCKICGVQSFYHPRSNPTGIGITYTCIDQSMIEKAHVHFEFHDFDGQNWEKFYKTEGGAAIRACSKEIIH